MQCFVLLHFTKPLLLSMQVYCNMDDDGGGWTLVWKHSAMEVLPLNKSMRYFSDYYKACTNLEVGWCNIPNKTRLNPTEMMIAAYHNKTLVFAYKGIFNKNLDWHWSGGILLDPKKVVDSVQQGMESSLHLTITTTGEVCHLINGHHMTTQPAVMCIMAPCLVQLTVAGKTASSQLASHL